MIRLLPWRAVEMTWLFYCSQDDQACGPSEEERKANRREDDTKIKRVKLLPGQAGLRSLKNRTLTPHKIHTNELRNVKKKYKKNISNGLDAPCISITISKTVTMVTAVFLQFKIIIDKSLIVKVQPRNETKFEPPASTRTHAIIWFKGRPILATHGIGQLYSCEE